MRRLILSAALLLAFFSALAQPQYSYGIDTRRDDAAFAAFSRKMDAVRRQRPVVALVLSGGGAKGAAHLRLLKALDEADIPVDMVLGTSVGGLIGGLYACGYRGEELEEIIRGLDWDNLLKDTYPRAYDALQQKDYQMKFPVSLSFGRDDFDLFEKKEKDGERGRGVLQGGIVQGQNVSNLFSSLLTGFEDEMDFLTLPIPFVCIATDVVTASPKVWHSGRLGDALRSTMSIPGLFAPFRTDGMVLMDGGLLNNFPAELARKMGADVVIGVDITSPGDANPSMTSLLDILGHVMSLMGERSYESGVAQSDLYVHPDISGYNMLSFDARSVDTLIQRGDLAVKEHQAEIDALRKALGRRSRPANARRAINTAVHPVRISGVSFEGVSPSDEDYLRELLALPDSVSKATLDNAVYTLMGTSAFERVTYELLGENAPFQLRFRCMKAPAHQVGVGFRFDTQENAALLLSVGLNTHQLTGSHLNGVARLGLRTYLDAEYLYRTRVGLDFGVEGLFKNVRNANYIAQGHQFQAGFIHSGVEAFLGAARWNQIGFRAGTRFEYFRYTSLMSDIQHSMSEAETPNKANTYTSLFAELRSDTYDDAYFPRSGARYSFNGSWFPFRDSPLYYGQAMLRVAATIGNVTILPNLAARYVSALTQVFDNSISVRMAGRTLDQQIPFIGINTAMMMQRMLAVGGVDLRFQLAPKHYLTAMGQYLRQSDTVQDFIDFKESPATNALGVGLEYAYNTLVGPIRADLHWSSLSRSVGLYISIGLDF